MTLDKAVEILNYNGTTGFAEVEKNFQKKLSILQFLVDSATHENFKELYLIHLSNVKKAFQQLKGNQESLRTAFEQANEAHHILLSSQDVQLLERSADEAFQDGRVRIAKEIYGRILLFNAKHNKAQNRIEVCNDILSEYQRVEDEQERIRILSEKEVLLQQEQLKREAEEENWINDTLLNNHKDNIPDGELSEFVKQVFLSGKGLQRLPTSNKYRKQKKEALLFGSVVLVFATLVLFYTYNDNILDVLQSYNIGNTEKKVYSAEEYTELADNLYIKGNYVKALIQYSLASSVAPDDPYIQEQIAVCKLLIQQDRKTIPASLTAQELIDANDSTKTDADSNIEKVDGDLNQINDITGSDLTTNNMLENVDDNLNNNISPEDSVRVTGGINSNNYIIANIDEMLPDTISSIEEIDSLLVIDDSVFVASMGDSLLPEVESITKKEVALSINDAEVKQRIIQKANSKIQEDNEFLSKIYLVAEKRPEPNGGFENFGEYLKRNLQYPTKALKNKIEGVVYVQFIVNRDGTVSNASTTTNLGFGLEEEAIRLVSEYPSWIPGQINSRNVNVQTSLPIWFVRQ